MRLSLPRLAVVALVLAAGGTAAADAPPLVPLQGYLTAPSGGPRHGTYPMRFRLYASATDTTALFDETSSVAVDHGRFVHYLGADEALDLAIVRDHATLYIGVQIGSDPEASPRIELASIPYAAFAQYCADAATLDGEDAAALHEYGALTNVPSSFPPSHHTHLLADVSGAQAVLASACPTGSSIRAIDPTGVVTCETHDNAPYTAGVGIVIGADRSIALDVNVVRNSCFDTEAELTAVLGDDYARLVHTHAASEITGDFGDLTATGTVTAGSFAYAGEVVRHAWVGSSEFHSDAPGGAGLVYTNSVNSTLTAQRRALVIGAPVDLPDGARLLGTHCYLSETNATENYRNLHLALRSFAKADMSHQVADHGGAQINEPVGVFPFIDLGFTTNRVIMIDSASRIYTVQIQLYEAATVGAVMGEFRGCDVTYAVRSPQ